MEETYTAWTEKHGFSEHLRGQDHLGLESVGENIYSRVTPGFTIGTVRARYYALYCWIFYDYHERGYFEKEDFTPFFRRREHAYALACLSHNHRPETLEGRGIIGSTNAKRYWRSGADPLDLSKEHIQEKLGGYGLYYRNAMQLVGLTYLEDGQEKLTESALGSPSGRQLAEAFEELIENTTYFRSWRDSTEVPRWILEKYGRAACVCEMADAKDGEVLRRTLLQPNPPEPDAAYREVHLSRTRTLTLIFEALSHSGTEYMNDLAWRNLHFYGSFSDGRDLAVPKSLADTALVWRMYQQRELHVFALTAMWVELLEWLRERRTATLGEWVEELASRVDLRRVGELFGLQLQEVMLSEVTIQELLDAVAGAAGVDGSFDPDFAGRVRDGIDRNHPDSESNIHIALLDGSLEDPAERVGVALWLSLVLYARTRDWPSEGPIAADLAAIGGARHWSVESFFREVDRRRNSSALEFLAWLYRNLVRQHLSIAMSKLPLDTFMLLYEDGALHYRASDRVPSLSDRYDIMLDVSWDLGWVNENSETVYLTELGERSKAEALSMLS